MSQTEIPDNSLQNWVNRWQKTGEQLRKIEQEQAREIDLPAFIESMEDAFEYAQKNIPMRSPDQMIMVKMRKILDDSRNKKEDAKIT